MGHVDHGKTSLLDAIRETEVVAGEAGGITQHIGAYQVHPNGNRITFLDTPGHEAFTAMRARGAKVTDVAVIVVAADDGVMPQTVEAIDHAKAADVPILIAVNKIDQDGAQPDKVRNELANMGLKPEDWGGETIFVRRLRQDEGGPRQPARHDPARRPSSRSSRRTPKPTASGYVIESHLDPGRGPVATVLVQRGTPAVGDAVVAGSTWGRVRRCSTTPATASRPPSPGDPVEVLGLDGVSEAGERFQVVTNDRRARQLAQERSQPPQDRGAGPPPGPPGQPRGGLRQGHSRARSSSSTCSSRRTSPARSRRSRTRSRSSPRSEIDVDVIHAAPAASTSPT